VVGSQIPYRWIAKASVQKLASITPDPDLWNHRVQSLFGRDVLPATDVLNRAEMVARHLGAISHAGIRHGVGGFERSLTFLEVGTGWHPVVPILLFLLGADSIVSVDHVDHSSDEKLLETVDVIGGCLADGTLRVALPSLLEDRLQEFEKLRLSAGRRSASDVMAVLRLERKVSDVRELHIDRPIDVILSNHVLEHIPAGMLPSILSACWELCAPAGVMSHTIDLIDHGHYVDSRLSQFNYLRFSPRQWKLVGNDIQHENRLRRPDYYAAYAAAGVPIDWEDHLQADFEHLARVPLAREYWDMDPNELLIHFVHFLSCSR
jgi:hypothetical protein